MFNMPPRRSCAVAYLSQFATNQVRASDCPLRPVPITGNVCSIPAESSAAINVAGTFQIGKYCVGPAYMLLKPPQSPRAHEFKLISGRHGPPLRARAIGLECICVPGA